MAIYKVFGKISQIGLEKVVLMVYNTNIQANHALQGANL